MQNPQAQWELIKFVVKANNYLRTTDKNLSDSMALTINYVFAYFESLITDHKIPVGRIAWRTEECSRLRLHFCKHFKSEQNARRELQNIHNAEVLQQGEDWLVLKPFGPDVLRFIIDQPLDFKNYVTVKTFKDGICDVEEAMQAW